MKEKEIQDDLASIRSLMERSSKFVSLSGLSGILAGVYALIGSAAAWYILEHPYSYQSNEIFENFRVVPQLVGIAILVLVASLFTGVYLSYKKAHSKGHSVWNKTSKELLFYMAVPLCTGGAMMLILLSQAYFELLVPTSLVFYGLALIGASNFTFTDVKFLGLCQIVLGLAAAALPQYGLILWAIGFGLLHIVYGSVMYLKYDR